MGICVFMHFPFVCLFLALSGVKQVVAEQVAERKGREEKRRWMEVRMEEMSRVLKDLERLLRKLSAEEWYEMMTVVDIERHFEEIKRELGQWFCEDAKIFIAS